MAVLRALAIGLLTAFAFAAAIYATGKPAIAGAWLILCFVDLQPLAVARLLGTTQSFAFAWVGAALLRVPVGLGLASWFGAGAQATEALPFVYLASLLLSAVLAAMIIGRSDSDAERAVEGR